VELFDVLSQAGARLVIAHALKVKEERLAGSLRHRIVRLQARPVGQREDLTLPSPFQREGSIPPSPFQGEGRGEGIRHSFELHASLKQQPPQIGLVLRPISVYGCIRACDLDLDPPPTLCFRERLSGFRPAHLSQLAGARLGVIQPVGHAHQRGQGQCLSLHRLGQISKEGPGQVVQPLGGGALAVQKSRQRHHLAFAIV